MIRALIVALLAGRAGAQAAPFTPRVTPRTILAVYDGRYQKDVRDTQIHRLLEMPLNHLGLVVTYCDLNKGLPSQGQMQDVRGIVTWFVSDSMEKPVEFLAWAEAAIDAGKRYVVVGEMGVGRNLRGQTTDIELINQFLARLGLRIENWTPVTYDVHVAYKDPAMMEFERLLPAVLPPFNQIRLLDPKVRSQLIVRRGNDPSTDSHLVVTGPHGGYAAHGYTHFASYRQDQLQWYLNPFEFLRLAFATDDLPKADTTTLSGRRIYYSHIDGDGWRNLTEVPRYRPGKLSSAEVILKETIEPFSDLPVTVGPIVADLDPLWFGTQESLSVARRILALAWVEAGSHTYSHPLDWETLGLASSASAERSTAQKDLDWMRWPLLDRFLESWEKPEAEDGKPILKRGHDKLRSYDLYPFNLDQEIRGSIEFIDRLLPPGKHVGLVQWSGTTLESLAALAATRAAGVRNINGGDTRFDPEFQSYAWVAPLGRQVGPLRQVYSSDSNENTYTNLWKERYFGFRYLAVTLRNTESPIRVKPFNLYYHMYSGEKLASLDALLENLALARSQELTPIHASAFAAIVDGFYSARITQIGESCWRIENRDGLNTIRFDRADGQAVDFTASAGVIGERHYQGSLYVALDAAEPAPVVAIRPTPHVKVTARPYLIHSRWQVFKFKTTPLSFECEAHGFGAGEMAWQVAPGATYAIRVTGALGPRPALRATSDQAGTLRLTIVAATDETVKIEAVELKGAK
jgi:hypothetical protein